MRREITGDRAAVRPPAFRIYRPIRKNDGDDGHRERDERKQLDRGPEAQHGDRQQQGKQPYRGKDGDELARETATLEAVVQEEADKRCVERDEDEG